MFHLPRDHPFSFFEKPEQGLGTRYYEGMSGRAFQTTGGSLTVLTEFTLTQSVENDSTNLLISHRRATVNNQDEA